jgi:hypothetical protein
MTRETASSRRARTLVEALRAAAPFPIRESTIRDVRRPDDPGSEVFDQARKEGLQAIPRELRRGMLARMTGSVAEAVATLILAEMGYVQFWEPSGVGSIDLLLLTPAEEVLALDVKGTLANDRELPSSIRRATPPLVGFEAVLADWALRPEDLYAGVMVVNLSRARYRVAISGDLRTYFPITDRSQLTSLAWLDPRMPTQGPATS